ncbi:TIGR01244 family sulfur transferase [Oleiagrimonas sp. C23AA]|uniref:TIGR01244 family sulfur transferase n=1 Tax=Oleiagrimonas sp. C23AA TaxID=2719047 RepID=UPI001420F45A|nr:TIGR01244 family sulfur transferase [Oleiagrimonas sp. C23AA]NII10931.1 TIGR01244 family phosphatase [Oleiagrimonas sp. C23AA]
MDMHALDDRLSVSGQITASDMATLRQKGFVAVINNRPDGESPDQPSAAQLAEAAKAQGLTYHYIPVVPQAWGAQEVAAFAKALADANGPVFAFCRSGMRSSTMWAMQSDKPAAQVLAQARAAGYDLSPIEPMLHQKEPR